MTTQQDIQRLQSLGRELGIQAINIGYADDGRAVQIDWNGDVEVYATVAEAEEALRAAAV